MISYIFTRVNMHGTDSYFYPDFGTMCNNTWRRYISVCPQKGGRLSIVRYTEDWGGCYMKTRNTSSVKPIVFLSLIAL
jgi:hypothetical protein